MENAKRFLARLRHDLTCASNPDSHTNHEVHNHDFRPDVQDSRGMAHQRPAQYPLSAPLGDPLQAPSPPLDTGTQLDDFDKQLLEEDSNDHSGRYQSALPRISLPPKPHTPLTSISNSRRVLQDDLHSNAIPQLSSSSPAQPVTSPTVSILHNRQQDTNKLSRNMTAASNLRVAQEYGKPAHSDDVRPQPSTRTPPSSALPVVQGIRLVPASALPDQLRSVFKFELFNAVQSKCFASAFKTDDNMVLSAPTGSGKTVIMELAICRLVAESHGRDFKVVYQAPTKSLCSERYRDWQTKFAVLNLQCAELTGDTDHSHLRNVQSANIIITTPEKWDSVTRKWKDHAKLLQLVKLFLVDEVHILKESRGATLEAVVSRMKSVSSSIRFVALSATVPNSDDIACWLGKSPLEQAAPARREVFGESFRPVQLRKHVYGFEGKGNDFAFESMLTQQIPDVISKHGQGKPVMVFCSTRRASVTTAKVLAKAWSERHPSQRLWKGPEKALLVSDLDLKLTCAAGVAFHHGGLSLTDRRAIEQAFLNGQISIICSTSTLAVGVNLPCYLVILKGTTAWTDNGMQEYADLEVMQMLGRAGRPQFENSACAVILTRKEKVSRYEKMVSGEELLESCLHQNLIEHLNAEVGLGSVDSLETAKQWLASTFLYVRLKKNPSHYRFREGVEGAEATEDEVLEQLCEKDIALLQDAGLVSHGTRLTPTEFGKAMARYYISFDTMKSFMGLPPKAKMSEILSVLVQAREFRDVRMLAGEKGFYKEINKAPEIKFPIKVDVALPSHKISLLIQADLGSVALPDGEHYKKHHAQNRSDKFSIFNHVKRLICCIVDCQIHLEDAVSVRHALELGRSLAAHVWDNTASQLRQIDGLGEVAVRKLASASVNSIDTLLNTEPSRIELVLGKNPPFGHDLLKRMESFPNLRVSVKETGRVLKAGKGATIKLVAEVGFLNHTVPQLFKKKPVYICFLAETSDGILVDFRRFHARNLQKVHEVFLTVQLAKATTHLNCYVMCDEIAGTCKYAELPLTDIPDSIYPSQRTLGGAEGGRLHNLDAHGALLGAEDDEFDDEGINDQDLLSVEAEDPKIEVIEDIDHILEAEGKRNRPKPPKQARGTGHETKPEHEEDADSLVYREPVQLDNGRWTCQHDCNERNKKCKHKCCREGVTKPRRRPKVESNVRHNDKAQTKLTAMTTKRMNLKMDKEVNKEDRSEPRLRTSIAPKTGTPEDGYHKAGKKHDERVGTNAIPRGQSRRISSGHQDESEEPATKRPRLSNDQGPDCFSNDGSNEDVFTDIPGGSLPNLESLLPAKTLPNIAATAQEDISPLSLDDDDLFNFSSEETELVDESRSEDYDLASFDNEIELPNSVLMAGTSTAMDNVYVDFLTSDIDLGGFEPPLEHVAMSDVHKKCGNACAGHGSTPVRQSTIGGDNMDLDEALSGTAVNFSDDFSMDGVDINSHSDYSHDLGDQGGAAPCGKAAYADMPAEFDAKTPDDAEEQAARSVSGKSPEDESMMESEHDREKRLYEEDQKKKWEGIDQWIYDEFHTYVELV